MAVLGVIADDFTGATDIAGMLVKGGMRTIQTIGVPAKGMIPDDVDAVVVALKTRSIAAKDAVAQSLDALKALQAAGCVRFFFKYCSTFDSTDAGNIGPVGDALLEALGAKQAIYCPAFPENGRTIFFGHLFVGDVLLSDSRMRHHPLNPMTDASLVRVLARQTEHKVGLVALKQVQAGSATLRAALDKLAADGVRHVVVDAVADTDLGIIGEAVGDDLLVTGGSGVALGLPAAYRRRGLLAHKANADTLPKITGAAAVLAGSCSAATLGQIAAFKGPHLHLDTDAICRGEAVADKALAWAKDKLGNGPILLSASEDPDAVKALQAKYGVEKSSHAIEKTMAALAKGLVAAGVAPPGRGRRRNLGRRGRRARRDGAAHRPGDRSRRAVDGIGRRQAAPAGAEVRQFRRARFLHQGVPASMSSTESKTRDAICALGAKLAARGLCPGTSGNISARVADGWLMTPTNSSLGELLPGQLSKIDLSGKHVAGDPPTKEALLHRSVYDVRPKDGAIVHLHCTHAVAISCLDPSCHHNKESTLPPITPYFVMRVGKLPLVPYFKPGDPKLADAIRDYAKGHRAVLLANHGPVVAGTSLSAASASIEELEETAKLHLLLQGFKVRLLSDAQVT